MDGQGVSIHIYILKYRKHKEKSGMESFELKDMGNWVLGGDI